MNLSQLGRGLLEIAFQKPFALTFNQKSEVDRMDLSPSRNTGSKDRLGGEMSGPDK